MGSFIVGRMAYDAVIVPNLRTIRTATLTRLERFRSAGGTVMFAGGVPEFVDAQPSPAAKRLARQCESVAFDENAILAALEPMRLLSLTAPDGSPTTSIAHQLRADGKERVLFLCNTDRRRTIGEVRVALSGRWAVERLDTFTGRASAVPAACAPDRTVVRWWCEAHDHLLLRMTPARRPDVRSIGTGSDHEPVLIGAPPRCALTPSLFRRTGRGGGVPITLSAPNVLLLDHAEWRLDGDTAWQPRDEVLRIDSTARARLGLPTRGGRDPQPWADVGPTPSPARFASALPFAAPCVSDRRSWRSKTRGRVRSRSTASR
jgi:hypothetical protein